MSFLAPGGRDNSGNASAGGGNRFQPTPNPIDTGPPGPDPGTKPQPIVPGQSTAPPSASPGSTPNPLQATYMPLPPWVTATMGGASQSNAPTSLSQSLLSSLSPNSTIAQIMQGFAPEANRSTAAMNNTLAAMGVVGGGAQDAQTLLQSNLASALAPQLAGAIENSQGNILNAGEFGVNNGLQQSLANAGFNQQQTLANQQASNQANLFNAQNVMSSNQYNATASNNSNNELASYMMQGWQMPFEAYNNINSMGLGGASQLATQNANNFPVYQSNNLMNLWGLI